MMTIPVTDVSNLLAPTPGTIEKTSAANPKQSDESSFGTVMTATAGKSAETVSDEEPIRQTQTIVEKPGRKDLDNTKAQEQQIEEGEALPDLKSFVTEGIEEIKNAIEEKFGIGEEELMAVMETMQLSMIDLLNPDKLKELMMTVAGQEDMVSVLTDEVLYTDMMDIVNLANDFTEEIMETYHLSEEAFDEIVNEVRMTEMPEQVIANETPEQTETDVLPEMSDAQIRVEITQTEAETASTSAKDEEFEKAMPVKTAPQQQEPTQETETVRVQSPVQVVTQTATTQRESFDEEGQNREALAQNMQQTQTQEVPVSDVAETVRQFSSYTNGEDVVNQVTEYIKVNISQETTSMELQLHPASLGTVNMNIISNNGVVTAQLLVQNDSVKNMLEAQLPQLLETFDEQGTKVEAVEVAVASYDLDRGPFQDRDDRQDRQNADNNSSRSRRRINLNLNDPDAELQELSEEDQLARDVMEMNGTSVDFSA
ncbi:MAG: flagellar hook-length control protein FliK [Lachnospiraceae bacterium]|nr:flagellar hook-length control protein FliK [Lachnospiraceae bacterium]